MARNAGVDGVVVGDVVFGGANQAGEAGPMIAGGVQSMSRAPFVMPKAETAFSRNAGVHDTTIGWRFVDPAMKAAHGVGSVPQICAADPCRRPARMSPAPSASALSIRT